jgi:TIR domain
MATIWMTYAWADNERQDIDFVAQELEGAGLTVKLDRWNLGAGKRLWEQIESFISKPEQSHAWLLVATNNSLASQPCKEEFAYALDRALHSRGEAFPVIALFLTHTDNSLIPAGIRTRLHVSITDPDWKERIVAAAENRPHPATRHLVQPYYYCIHSNQPGNRPFSIEVRPRAGVWAPFMAAIPLAEKDKVDPSIMIGPRDFPIHGGMLMYPNKGPTTDNSMWAVSARNECTPTRSYYIWCKQLPSRLVFGVADRHPQFTVVIKP